MTHTEFRSIILLRSGYLEDQERGGKASLILLSVDGYGGKRNDNA